MNNCLLYKQSVEMTRPLEMCLCLCVCVCLRVCACVTEFAHYYLIVII